MTDSVIGLSWTPKLLFETPSTSTITNGKPEVATTTSTPTAAALWKPRNDLLNCIFVPPNDPKKLNKLAKNQIKNNAGTDWFDMPAPTISPQLKKDLQLLKLRNVIDPKRHYKKGDSKLKDLPKYFQVGTVVESASEFYSGRLTKKERKASLADELLSEKHLTDYRKRKVREIEEKNRLDGVHKWKNKGNDSWKRAKRNKSIFEGKTHA